MEDAQQPKNDDLVKKYFTKDIMDIVNKMTFEEMKVCLKELEGTKYWFAIIKYNQDRLANAQNGLIVTDPFKNPTVMARYQGIMSGVLDLQDAVIRLKAGERKAEDPAATAEDKKNELGGAYGVI